MILRPYVPEDCPKLAALFYETVHTVNAKDYSPEQRNAWATGQVDLTAWNESFLAHKTLVAWDQGRIVGFGDMDPRGFLDRLYVHKDAQRKGIGTALCDGLECAVSAAAIVTHASITARPFFEARGYTVLREQQVERQGILLTNYVMEKRLPLRSVGQLVTVTVDRPMGSYHPKHPDLYYPINYGYIQGVMAPDGEEQDAYLLGVDRPVHSFTGRVIALVHRRDDVEEKWVVAPEGMSFSREEIWAQISFQEQFFQSELHTSIEQPALGGAP